MTKKTKQKTKAKKAPALKRVSRKKPAAKKVASRAKAKARPATPLSSTVAWPGLPPGYFDRAR